VLGSMLSPEFEENTRVNRAVSLFGYGFCILMLWMTSRNRRRVDWHTVIVGIFLHFVIALVVLHTNVGYNVFNWISRMCRQVLGYSDLGLAFLTDATVPRLPWLLITIITPLVFFAGLAQVLSYWFVTLSKNRLHR
jgi:CNT family concentrative nucleoside transporter